MPRRFTGAAECWMPVATGRKQVMMQAQVAGRIPIGSAHRMFALGMQAAIQRLAQDAPLQREVSSAPQVVGAVDGPTQRTMIDDHPIDIFGVERVDSAR